VIEATELLSRGLHRDYLRFDEELTSPKGRIHIDRFSHAYASGKSSLFCTYHNRSEAILLNRVLLAGLRLAGRVCRDVRLSIRVYRLAQILEATVPTVPLSKADVENAQRIIDRRNIAYSSAITLIGLLTNGMGIAVEEANHTIKLSGFLFNMNSFFQSLISRFLHEELRGFAIQDERRLNGIFEYDPRNNPLRRRAVTPRPDFAVLSHGNVVEFLDAKYRDLWETGLPPNMLYQLAIYALSKTTGTARSTILYPTLESAATDQILMLKDPISATKRAEIVLRPVNLLEMERLVRLRRNHAVRRQREDFAETLVFGSKLGTLFVISRDGSIVLP
jgi:5-methylcytosine-specific restriction enzyme subunit McrC